MITDNLIPKSNLKLIQLLRGIASLLVVLMHATGNIAGGHYLGGFFNFGGAGVDIFFVLSGFIITYTSNIFSAKKSVFSLFLKRRFVRIFPVYWIICTVFLAIHIALPSFYRTHYDFTVSNLFNTYFLLPGHQMINGVSWSLSYEIFFYILFSMAFLIRQKTVIVLFLISYVSLILMFSLFNHNLEGAYKWVSFFFYPMITEFFMGILAALVIPKLPVSFALPFLIIGSCTFIGFGIYSNIWGVSVPGHFGNVVPVFGHFGRVVLFGIPSFFIIVGMVKYELSRLINLHNIFILMGQASYSLYLIHLPILAAGLKIITMVFKNNMPLIYVSLTILIFGICFISLYFFRFVEKPLIDQLNKRLKTK